MIYEKNNNINYIGNDVASCSYLDASREEVNKRGVECRYNKRGGVENCRYMN